MSKMDESVNPTLFISLQRCGWIEFSNPASEDVKKIRFHGSAMSMIIYQRAIR